MKKLALTALAVTTALVASPAMAATGDATGTVDITGYVSPKCLVLTDTATDSFSTTVALGDLAGTDGKLATDLATRFSTPAAGSLQQKVVCTTANPTIAVDADPITTGATADSGYANRIDYQADVTLTTIDTNASPYSNDSAASAGAAVAIGSRLANAADNVSIAASNFRTNGGLLVSGDYTGKITIVISPGT